MQELFYLAELVLRFMQNDPMSGAGSRFAVHLADKGGVTDLAHHAFDIVGGYGD